MKHTNTRTHTQSNTNICTHARPHTHTHTHAGWEIHVSLYINIAYMVRSSKYRTDLLLCSIHTHTHTSICSACYCVCVCVVTMFRRCEYAKKAAHTHRHTLSKSALTLVVEAAYISHENNAAIEIEKRKCEFEI